VSSKRSMASRRGYTAPPCCRCSHPAREISRTSSHLGRSLGWRTAAPLKAA
jgi:hypothetical protein